MTWCEFEWIFSNALNGARSIQKLYNEKCIVYGLCVDCTHVYTTRTLQPPTVQWRIFCWFSFVAVDEINFTSNIFTNHLRPMAKNQQQQHVRCTKTWHQVKSNEQYTLEIDVISIECWWFRNKFTAFQCDVYIIVEYNNGTLVFFSFFSSSPSNVDRYENNRAAFSELEKRGFFFFCHLFPWNTFAIVQNIVNQATRFCFWLLR